MPSWVKTEEEREREGARKSERERRLNNMFHRQSIIELFFYNRDKQGGNARNTRNNVVA
jgi:hypothetical protein